MGTTGADALLRSRTRLSSTSVLKLDFSPKRVPETIDSKSRRRNKVKEKEPCEDL